MKTKGVILINDVFPIPVKDSCYVIGNTISVPNYVVGEFVGTSFRPKRYFVDRFPAEKFCMSNPNYELVLVGINITKLI